MGFNYGLEKKKFDAEWEKLRKEYRAAGMDEDAIEAMYEFDWKAFNEERAYRNHTQSMPELEFDGDGDFACEDKSPLLDKFLDSLSVSAKETDDGRRDSWLDEIDSPKLSAALHRMSSEDIELLTMYVFDGFTVTEIAEMKGIAHQNVSKKIRRIKKILKKI